MSDSLSIVSLFISFGISYIACFLSVLARGGAGLVLFPMLILFGTPFEKALALQKISAIFLAFESVAKSYKNKLIDRKLFYITFFSGLPFVLAGTLAAGELPKKFMAHILGVAIIGVAALIIIRPSEMQTHKPRRLRKWTLLKFLILLPPIAFYSGWLNAGASVFLTVFFTYVFHYDRKHASALAVAGVVVAWNLVSVTAHAMLDEVWWTNVPSVVVGSLAGSQTGRFLVRRYHNKYLKYLFHISVLVCGLLLIK